MKSIIWNMTRLCPWTCKFCCVGAECISGLKKVNTEKDKDFKHNNELSFNEKINVIDQLKKGDFRIDFSGGDLLIDPLNLDVVLYASEKLGKENVGISVSGAFIDEEIVSKLEGKINDVEMTLDYVPFKPYKSRPIGYHEYTANAVSLLREKNISVGVQTVLTNDNISKEQIKELYDWLIKHNVNGWSLLRYFSSGRGEKFTNIMPSHIQYEKAVDYIKNLTKGGNVDVHFQYLLPNHSGYTLNCRAVKHSIGILPDGTVTACFWGLNEDMKAIDHKFVLGFVPDMNIYNILQNDKSQYWINSCNECEIFTYNKLEKNFG